MAFEARSWGPLVASALALAIGQGTVAHAQDTPGEPAEDAPADVETDEGETETGETEDTGEASAAGGGGPESATTTVVHDDESELERMQREAEAMERADQEEMVVEPAAADEELEGVPEDSLMHLNQVGLRIGLGAPYVFAVKYGEGPRCGEDPGETFCRRLGSITLDAELGFGVSDTVELSILTRFGLNADDAAEARPLTFGFGARAYTAPHSIVKLYFGGRAMLDVTSSDVPEWSTVDVGVRGELGLQVDLARYVGLYVQLGETISFLRGLYFVTDGTGGAQVRFP